MSASAHDTSAFQSTGAAKYPEFFFQGNEFAWADFAYLCTLCMMPIHKKLTPDDPRNAVFDKAVSHSQVQSEHCIGVWRGDSSAFEGSMSQLTVHADTTGFGSNVLPYSSFGLRCKTSLCFENNFGLGLSHNQYGYNLNHSSNSHCDLVLHHAIPWSQSASTFQLYVSHRTLLQV